MGTKARLKATALTVAAVVLGLLTAEGTLATWSEAAASAPQTVGTADFAVVLAPQGGAAQRLPAGGTVTVPAATGIMPGETRTTAIAVTNATDAGSGSFTARAAVGTPQTTGALAPHLATQVRWAADGSSCAALQQGPSRDLPQGATRTLCVTTTLAAATPATAGGGQAATTFTLTAQQL